MGFIDLITNHDEVSTGVSTWDKVHNFIEEVNTVLGEDRNSKHAFAMQLSKQQWFSDNYLEVRYRPGQNSISVSQTMQQQAPPQMMQMQFQGGWQNRPTPY